jgi:flagellar biosynthesis protein FliQ
MNSLFLTLNTRDFVKGLFIAVITAVITVVYTTIQTGTLSFDWKVISTTALSAALAYIMKNLFTNSNDQLLKKDPA